MTTSPHLDAELERLLDAHLLAAPSDPPPAALAAHLERCEQCAAELTRTRLLEAQLERLHADFALSDGFLKTLLERADACDALARAPDASRPPAEHRRWFARQRGFAAALVLAASLAALGIWKVAQHAAVDPGDAAATTTVVAMVTAISAQGSLRTQQADGSWRALRSGERVLAPATLVTGADGRVALALTDGSRLLLARRTTLTLRDPRALRLMRGVLLADVRPRSPEQRLRIALPTGAVEVLGTKFNLDANAELATVDVVRGVVRLVDRGGRDILVGAGHQGSVASVGRPVSGLAPDLGRTLAWSEPDDARADSASESGGAGFGSLQARRPGRSQTHALALAEHRVDVRIQAAVARTEIRETFRNDTRHTLEGIYRFPLPSGARISRLALYVDGKLEEGTIVERDRAQRIWRGVLRQATPKTLRKQEEYVWVPGPWRDPALLEWQQGNQFELRIFPIPARGSRTVILAYTETLEPTARGRRYVYPLPQGGAVRAERFELTVRLAGHDPTAPVLDNYGLVHEPRASELRLRFARASFAPRGDLALTFATPRAQQASELWAYREPTRRIPPWRDPARRGPAPPPEPGWLLLRLRPPLEQARARASEPRDLVIVVDRSYSNLGEAARRQVRLLRELVRELDRRDRVAVLACDQRCRQLGVTGTDAETGWSAPSLARAKALATALDQVEPGGATDLGGALTAAATLLRTRPRARPRRVIYIGDGVPTTGQRELAGLVQAVRETLRPLAARLSTVGVGTAVDGAMLRALARAGGGSYVAYAPGTSARGQALVVLARQYGVALRGARLSLPLGLELVAPQSLPALQRGEELLVTARLSGPVRGTATLEGTVGAEVYRHSFAIDARPTSAPEAAFVPRLWAQLRLDDLTASSADRKDRKAEIVALSRRYRLLSRYTSLLVLESEAMRRAFDVHAAPDRIAATAFGEDLHAESLEPSRETSRDPSLAGGGGSAGSSRAPRVQGKGGKRARVQASMGSSGSFAAHGRGFGRLPRYGTRAFVPRDFVPGETVPPRSSVSSSSARVHGSLDASIIRRVLRRNIGALRSAFARQLKGNPSLAARVQLRFTIGADGTIVRASAAGAPAALAAELTRVVQRMRFPQSRSGGQIHVVYPLLFKSAGEAVAPPSSAAPGTRLPPLSGRRVPLLRRPWPPRRWVRMRRQWYQVAQLTAEPRVGAWELAALEQRRRALEEKPLSRARTRRYYRALSRAGRGPEALALIEAWLRKEPHSAAALTLLVEAAARVGQRERALRALGSLVELAPADAALVARAASALARAGQRQQACAMDTSLAQLRPRDDRVAQRVRDCREGFVQRSARHGRGRIVLEARWEQPVDADLALVDGAGRRLTWLSNRSRIDAARTLDDSGESLALAWLPSGRYRIELVAARAGVSLAGLRGSLRVRAPQLDRRLRFRMHGGRRYLAELVLERKSRLVPAP